MKRFWVFSFPEYYPGGGLHDLVGSFDTMEEAITCAVSEGDDHAQILDAVERKAIKIETEERDGHLLRRVAR